MRIIIIGAPGAGKSTIARELSSLLQISHLKADDLFWGAEDFRREIDHRTEEADWILEGHLSKHHDLTFPKAQAFLVISGPPLVYLLRSLKRDVRRPKKFWFNLRHHRSLEDKRQGLIRQLKEVVPEKLFYLENLSYPTEGELKTLAEALQGATSKS